MIMEKFDFKPMRPYVIFIIVVLTIIFCGFSLYHQALQVQGDTPEQIKLREEMNRKFEAAEKSFKESRKWYDEWKEREFPVKTDTVYDVK